MSNTIYQPMALRLYFNPHYGKWSGPGKKNQAFFNGSLELPEHHYKKLWVDLASLDEVTHCSNPAQSSEITTLTFEFAKVLGFQRGQERDYVAGQLKYVSPLKYVFGLVVFSTVSSKALVVITEEGWKNPFHDVLSVHVCRAKDGSNAPGFLAANYDVATGHKPSLATPDRMAEIKKQLGVS